MQKLISALLVLSTQEYLSFYVLRYFKQNYGFKAKTFIPISFANSTGTHYTTWLTNAKLLLQALERKESE